MDLPKDIQQQLAIPDWDEPMSITGYVSRLPPPPEESRLRAVVEAIKGSKKPVGGKGESDDVRARVNRG